MVSSLAKPSRQAEKAVKKMGEPSVRTRANYRQVLTQTAQWMQDHRLGSLRDMTPDLAQRYLAERSEVVGQSALDMDRQAIEKLPRVDEQLPRIQSERQQALQSRAYTPDQVRMIAARQSERHAITTELAEATGIRAHEAYTIRPISEQPPSDRPWRSTIGQARSGVPYTVKGKGGLTREIIVPRELADRLEARRLPEPHHVTDRGVHYRARYDIGAGKQWSDSFSRASGRALGWSHGAHGLRHSYAQSRMEELQRAGHSYRDALGTISNEMGHFRESITEVYLR